MSRRSRDEAAAALAVGAIKLEPPDGPTLVLEDPRPDVADAVRRTGQEVARWSRYGGDQPWPEMTGDAALVALRLPRARRELEMLLHMAAGAARVGGRLLVYGANDEGIKSVSGRVEPLFARPITLATGGHARLIGAWRAPDGPAPRSAPGDWMSRLDVNILGRTRPWVSYPGVFAHGRVDEGTALLLEHLPAVSDRARVLDYGAGTGVLAAGVLERCPTARVTALEPDGLAAAAATENVPGLRVCVGRGWTALDETEPWDLVVANPPYHRGKAETLAEIESFLAGVRDRLSPRGSIRCVVQRRLPFDERAQAAGLAQTRVVADRGPYRIWDAAP